MVLSRCPDSPYHCASPPQSSAGSCHGWCNAGAGHQDPPTTWMAPLSYCKFWLHPGGKVFGIFTGGVYIHHVCMCDLFVFICKISWESFHVFLWEGRVWFPCLSRYICWFPLIFEPLKIFQWFHYIGVEFLVRISNEFMGDGFHIS